MSDLAQDRQLQRLKYIDLCAYVLGYVNRNVIMNRFDVKQVCATKDINAYQEKTGANLVYDHAMKCYRPVDWFSPLFEHDVVDALELMNDGKQSIFCEPRFANNSYSYAIKSVQPLLKNLHNVFRALSLGKKVEIDYVSLKTGSSNRLIAPHSLIRTGCFTYVRAFDHQSGEFRSFKLNRIINSKIIDITPLKNEIRAADKDWQSEVTLIIKVNDGVEHKEAIEFDYGLVNGVLEVSVKKALIMFFLMDWNIAPLGFEKLPEVLYPLKLDSIIE
ncbi:WYL domain-containing protein [Aeromonas sobria]|uniref:WYL domain-containing protein n=1 Tax=Aeromonas sobria TaxID=646 RepID=UPI000C6E4125|nr:WYL domain-containing protein [Aeromonas sobria]PKQ73658.1 hypothetical protein CJF47_15835 [Aeromonas sobria]